MQNVNLHTFEKQRIQAGLARLLGGENFSISFQVGADTASFDLAERRVTLPIWNDSTPPEMIDWLTIHEIGHGLYTDLQILNSGLEWAKENKINQNFFSVIHNVVEDIRINRLLRQRFPGAVKDFIEAYRYRFNHNHYGSQDSKSLNNLGFVDRLNIHMKAGHCVNIGFSADEIPFVKESDTTMTNEEVMELSKKIALFLKKKYRKNKLSKLVLRGRGFATPISNSVEYDPSDTNDHREEAPCVNNDRNIHEDEEIKVEETPSTTPTAPLPNGLKRIAASSKNEDDEAEGEDSSVSNQSEEADEEYTEQIMSYEHEGKHTKTYVDYVSANVIQIDGVNNKEILKPQFFIDEYNKKVASVKRDRSFENWYKNTKNLVNDMVSVFESRKAASSYRKTAFGKTGVINPNKLYSYKTAEDIFKKVGIVQNEKSHCFVMFIDTSSSMSQIYSQTVRQALMLAMFCRAIDVPFKIMAYSGPNGLFPRIVIKSNGQPLNVGVTIGELINSEVSKTDFEKLIFYWYTVTSRKFDHLGKIFHHARGGTPTLQAIIASTEYLVNWMKSTKSEICNFVDLTDGECDFYGAIQRSVIIFGSKYFKPLDTYMSMQRETVMNMFRFFAKEIGGIKSMRLIKYHIYRSSELYIKESKDRVYDNNFFISSKTFSDEDSFNVSSTGELTFKTGKQRFFVKNLANYLSTTVD